MIKCPYCEREEQQVKIGHNASGSQRYKCKNCRRKYTPEPKQLGHDEGLRKAAVQLYVDGMNLRRIARTLGVTHPSVAAWVKAHAESLPDAPPSPAASVEVNELDEMFTFIGNKKTKSTSSPV
jgi:transposase-like protein